jgi:hypothetical protein
MVLGMTMIVIGIQVLFTGFVLGILKIPTAEKRSPPPNTAHTFDVALTAMIRAPAGGFGL